MHEKFMKRCLELATSGLGKVAPNPMVGSVIVHDGKIIGEGFHSGYGNPHAEVEAIRSVEDKNLLAHSTLYVNLEPCNHFGKTPPCTDLILENKIPEVVICNVDSNPLVSGKGIARLKENGIRVTEGILKEEGLFLNRRFFTFHSKKRPYIILKWAQTRDGYIDQIRNDQSPVIHQISSDISHQLSHRWRSEEMAILVGKNTVINDNPQLTTRKVKGKNPIRILIDPQLKSPLDSKIFNEEATTIVLNSIQEKVSGNIQFHQLNSLTPENIASYLFQLNIQSILIEGGTFTLQKFIDAELWDEARVFTAPTKWEAGLLAPELNANPSTTLTIDKDQLKIYYKK